MANLGMVVNVNEIPDREDFSPVPPGVYSAIITDSEMKPTSSGGEMLVLTIELQENNRKIFERLNLKNDNETAVKIAFQTLGEIIKAVGKTTIKDSNELHNKRISVEVVVDPAKPYVDKSTGEQKPGNPQNRVKKYSVYGASNNNGNQSQSTQSEASSPASSNETLPPWKRK